ncbi:MAG: hypothetical protein KBT48_10110 [Firmicutes bacterium]|nr:hypothetical protein [Bacillota bacterium]
MNINTSQYRSLSKQIAGYIRYGYVFTTPSLSYRHNQIQKKLSSLSSYFSQSASSIETNESSLLNSSRAGVQMSFNHYINWNSILSKKEGNSSANFNMKYAYKEVTAFQIQSKYFNSRMDFDIGQFRAQGDAKLAIWKNKILNPDLSLVGSLYASLFTTGVSAQLGNGQVYANLNANGSVGTVYANCKGVLNVKEQTLELGIGAAGAHGEVSCSFNVMGKRIILTGQGSIGSAEANISYSHKNREWEFGSKLGFIAGLGFKVHVNY